MSYIVTIRKSLTVECHTVIGNVGEFVDRAYDGGALGVTIVVRK